MTSNNDIRVFVNGRLQLESQGEEASAEECQAKTTAPSVEDIVESLPFVVISVGNCPQCEELAAFLAARGVPGTVLVKWDRSSADYPALKASLAHYAGEIFSFPQVFAEGLYQGSFKEVMEQAERGVYDDLFAREFEAEPRTLQRIVERQSMVVLSLPNCPQCDELRDDLEKRGLPVKDIFIKLEKAKPEYPSLKAQLSKMIQRDQFAFPQTFVRGAYEGSFGEVIAKVSQGEFAQFFADEFGIPMPEVQPSTSALAALDFDDDF